MLSLQTVGHDTLEPTTRHYEPEAGEPEGVHWGQVHESRIGSDEPKQNTGTHK